MRIDEILDIHDASDNIVLTDDQLIENMAPIIEALHSEYGPEFIAKLIIDINDYKLEGSRLDIELKKRIKRLLNDQERSS